MACVGTLSSNHSLYYSASINSATCLAPSRRRVAGRLQTVMPIRAESMTIEKLGIKIERNPPENKLTQLGVRQWPKWSCPPSKFPWTYDAKETCYLLEGKVKVTPTGANEAVEIAAGDLVVFPKGMSCSWDVSVGVNKHYNFE
ncbi:hypothetical protein L6164_006205 [Bauhinia variegata]|uniref:Uncharacterized protein n=1 Tax=Bauhinia variegata TaxID=167791 RepID=A0ACB9PVJ2_BAUVA|nr:hypothetical protein L6164_006205 [Bauhinia variegata]